MTAIPDRINFTMQKRFKKHGTSKIDNEVTLRKVYQKNNGICQSCGVQTEYLHPPRPHSASIEHIIPLSNGGSHTWDNVELLCHKCNTGRNTERQIVQNKQFLGNPKTINVLGFVITIRRAS